MEFQLSKYFEGTPPTGTLADFMFKNCSLSSCAFPTKWTSLTKGNSEYQWTLWGTFEIPKLNFLKTKLDYNNFNISRTKWYAYFD